MERQLNKRVTFVYMYKVEHFTTRTYDSHATPVISLYQSYYSHNTFLIMSRAGKVLRVVSN